MALDQYSLCPCGSGKKFKWCCQPIHVQISQAFEQDAGGQHDTALRIMEEVVTAHPTNPEAWGRKAQLLYQNEKVEEAEQALSKALELNPHYPFGNYLRGRFRHFEGEIRGALLLYRKAADYYDPAASSALSSLYTLIGECEMALNNPVAARAAVQMAQRFDPANPNLGALLASEFGNEARLPLAAKREYQLQPLTRADPQRRAAWDQALKKATTGQLGDAARAFEELTGQDAQDGAAWYNLGLTRAWLGQNAVAIDAVERYLTLEKDETKGAAAWALAEVLRCGQGLEDQADYVDYSYMGVLRDGEAFGRFIQDLSKERRFIPGQRPSEEDPYTFTALVLEKLPALTPELAARQSPHLAGTLFVNRNFFRIWNAHKEPLDQLMAEMQQKIGATLAEVRAVRGPVTFASVLSEGLVLPVTATDEPEIHQRVDEGLTRFFEETWLTRPLRSLGNIPPVDAAGHPHLRKKLLGIMEFYQECLNLTRHEYDFERLKHKLGMGAPVPAGPGCDIAAMSAADLAALGLDSLADDQVELAFQTALCLDARDLASRFAQALVTRPGRPERADRYLWFNHLIQAHLTEGNNDKALDFVNEGEKDDCEYNEGRRRNEYELRRGQIHLRRGDVAQAQDVFERLIARVPDELRYRGSAAEAMLSARQGTHALRFAQDGLALARKQNNRDSEQHFLELMAAAQKQGGG